MRYRLTFWTVCLATVLFLFGSGESSAQTPASPTTAPESSVAAPASNDGTLLTNSVGMDLKLIPAGTFKMGDNSFFIPDMQPAHKVTLTKDFYIGVYEVTQEQYERVMGNNPSRLKSPQNPVVMVSWDDAVEFCRKLSELPEEIAAGYVYRLPTEAEWEYACRAGTKTVYSFGNDESQLGDFEWYYKNSDGATHPVGQKKPNGWGLYDMHGNVQEWCENRFYYYANECSEEPKIPSGKPMGFAILSRHAIPLARPAVLSASHYNTPKSRWLAQRIVRLPTTSATRHTTLKSRWLGQPCSSGYHAKASGQQTDVHAAD